MSATLNTGILKFIDYVTAFNPAFPSRIRGATQEEIARLEQLAGPPLPSFYREYLERMGHGDDELIGRPEPITDITDVITFYEENVASGENPVPDGCIFIGVGGCCTGNVVVERGAHGRVFDTDDGEKDILWAESLENLLYHYAYMIYRPKQFPYDAFYVNTDAKQVVASASMEAAQMGFKPLWFSDAITFCAERDDSVLILSQRKGSGLGMLVGATRWNLPNQIARRLANAAGVKIEKGE